MISRDDLKTEGERPIPKVRKAIPAFLDVVGWVGLALSVMAMLNMFPSPPGMSAVCLLLSLLVIAAGAAVAKLYEIEARLRG